MKKHVLETIIGAVVIAFAATFLFTAYSGGAPKAVDGYQLSATFERVDGLNEGSDVRVSGLRVGRVASITLDPQSYNAKVLMDMDQAIRLPADSSAEIISDGLLGSKYLALVPGGAEEMYQDGDAIQFTQSAISIESLIGKFVFGSADEKPNAEDSGKDEDNIF